MECEDKAKKQSEMVANLQSRRKALEAKIREKNDELKHLCVQEAELTGVLPPEIPLEPGESPPVFRRRMGTAFVIPENLINKLKSKEEESLANLELECKIQTSIAEAALGLANDGTVSKSVRRKHRLMYQQSQRRLHELEAKLNALRQNSRSHPKQRKKPRPPLESENDCVDGNLGSSSTDKNETKNQPYHPALSYTVSDKGPIRHSFPVNNFHRIPDPAVSQRHFEYNYLSTQLWQQHYTNDPYERDKHMRSGVGGQINREPSGWTGDSMSNINNNLRIRPNASNINELDRGHQLRDRFGSLDRRRLSIGGHQHGNNNEDFEHLHHSRSNHIINNLAPPSQPYQSNPSQLNSVLLPNQTYPENSLMRTQSLGSVELTKCDPDTRSLKSNPHNSSHAFESLKPEANTRNSKLDYQNHNYIEPNKYHNDTTSLKLEPNELYKMSHNKFRTEPEFPKSASSHENLKFEQNLGPSRGHHHNHHSDYGKYDLKTVVEGSTLNSYSQSHHDLNLNLDLHSLSIDPKDLKKPDSIKRQLLIPHEFNTQRSDLRQYPPRFPEPPRPVKYPPKPELRPSLYRDREERLNTEVVQAMCADSYHHETVVPVETVNEPLPKKYDPEPTESADVAIRKTRDKEWYETSLDSRQMPEPSQTPPLPPQFSSPPPPPLPPPPRSVTPNLNHNPPVTTINTQPTPPQPVEFDTVVPFESPKNHTVVQAGKWQPYREVTKPFEMADFYKYSTKFRNKSAMPNVGSSGAESVPTQSSPSSSQLSPQHKGVYKPLKSMTCQPLSNNSSRNGDTKTVSDVDSPSGLSNSSQIQSPPSLANAFSTEMLAWYQDQSSAPQTRSATLV